MPGLLSLLIVGKNGIICNTIMPEGLDNSGRE
jgi:hypothetical protein